MIKSRKRRAILKLNLRETNADNKEKDEVKEQKENQEKEQEYNQSKSHIPQSVQISLETNGHKYFCKKCNVGFQKQKSLKQHLEGRKHERVVSEWESANRDYASEAPTWKNQPIEGMDYDGNEAGTGTDTADDIDVCTFWRDTELSDFPHRSSCIDQSLMVSTLSPQLRARFWRYLRDTFGKHYPELASILHHVSVSNPQYLRVKELFENLEAFQIVSSIIIMSQDTANNIDPNGSSTSTGTNSPKANIDTIYDLACGHGLLGILLAYRFPTKKVVCVDLEKRESFYAFREAFNAKGESYQGAAVLSNLEYREANLLTVETELSESSCLVAIHACNDANKHVADMATRANATWAVMPCCIRSKLYLGGAPVYDLDSETRYKLLCGAFAEANNAKVIRSISRDITARPILVAGGFVGNNDSARDEFIPAKR